MRERLLPGVVLVALVAGCTSAPPSQVGGDCASAAPGTVEVTAAVKDGRADPAPRRVPVPLGSPIRVRVAADAPAEVHVHGYDLEAEAAPDRPGCVTFVADRSGLFDVEAHPETLLVQLEVR